MTNTLTDFKRIERKIYNKSNKYKYGHKHTLSGCQVLSISLKK